MPLKHTVAPGRVLLSVPQARLSLTSTGQNELALPADVVGSRYLGGAWQLQLKPKDQSRTVHVTSIHEPGRGPHQVHVNLNDLHLLATAPE